MPIAPTYPGVYVQEVPSGVRAITGVSTSVGLFVGFTRSGPVDKPTLCTSFSDYARVYGEDTTAGDMTRQVKLFFLNGGTRCFVVRVAQGASSSSVTLDAQDGATAVLTLTAASAGLGGDLIRAAVTYSGTQPEDTFNLELFRWQAQPNGTLIAVDPEVWRGLSMDPDSGSFAPAVLNASSKLVTASSTVVPAAAGNARSYAMLPFTAGSGETELAAQLAIAAELQVSINGSPFVTVDLSTAAGATEAAFATSVASIITTEFSLHGYPTNGFSAGWETAVALTWFYLEGTDGNVFVRRSGTSVAATNLRFGAEQGGIEVTRYAALRPAPTGVTLFNPDFNLFETLLPPAGSATVLLNRYDVDGNLTSAATATVPNPHVTATWPAGADLREILAAIRDAIVAGPDIDPGEVWPWTAELWGYRLAIRPTSGPVPAGSDDNRTSGYAGGLDLATAVVADNVRYYSLGTTGLGIYQGAGAGGADGTSPTLATTYDDAYTTVEREVDLFNLMILPRSADESALSLEDLWPNASIFAQERRALLLMEPPLNWSGAQQAMNEVTTLRIGLSKQYSALYYPRIEIQEGRLRFRLGATGAMAGLMARIDSARGVWKAPAGTEADLRGIVGVSELFSDRENGVLNPRAINVIRSFPMGIVAWGARTMDGDDDSGSEYKYVPIRRLALFLEESLFRGLKWVVFEPNDEPLWSQIRLNVNAFMQGLFRQGAFQGKTPQEAFFVKCDSETTTQADRNLGIVNIWVGFAPLKPAEFVILSIQQMAGQLELA
jgi:hypothetical protein